MKLFKVVLYVTLMVMACVFSLSLIYMIYERGNTNVGLSIILFLNALITVTVFPLMAYERIFHPKK